METFLGYIPNSSSKVRVFQSPEKKVTVDHILWYKTSNGFSVTTTHRGGERTVHD